MRGFTLVEMVTVIAIMAIIMGTLFANFRSWGGVSKLERDANDVASLVSTARQNSISVVKFGSDYPSYGVSFSSQNGNNTVVTLYARCVTDISSGSFDYTGNTASCSSGKDVTAVTLTGSTVSNLSYDTGGNGAINRASVLFVRPDPIVKIYRNNTVLPTGTLTVTLQSTDGNATLRYVKVNTNGFVSISQTP